MTDPEAAIGTEVVGGCLQSPPGSSESKGRLGWQREEERGSQTREGSPWCVQPSLLSPLATAPSYLHLYGWHSDQVSPGCSTALAMVIGAERSTWPILSQWTAGISRESSPSAGIKEQGEKAQSCRWLVPLHTRSPKERKAKWKS